MNYNRKKTVTFLYFFCLITICNLQSVHAQSRDSLLKIYNNETIQTSGSAFIQGGKRLTFGELKPLFTSPITIDLYKNARNQCFLGGASAVVAIGALVTAAFVKKDNKGAGWALSIGGIGLNLLGLHLKNRSTEVLDRAIWQRNKEVLFGPGL